MAGKGRKKVWCHKHEIGLDDEEWQVIFAELTEEDEDGESQEPFEGHVCPKCYVRYREKYKKARRNVRVESKRAVRLQQENDRLQEVLDAVISTVEQMTGKDPVKLAKADYHPSALLSGGVPGIVVAGGGLKHPGDLKNILPNLIAEAASKGKK